MDRKAFDFSIQEAGCLLYAADRNLGGRPFGSLDERRWRPLTLRGALMATSLYQDDGYRVRIVFGDLNDEEKSEWTARVAWKLNLESGKMVVSGVCDSDLENYLENFPAAEPGGDYPLGCLVEAPPGEYAVTIHSYPPSDLSGGWMAIEDPDSYKTCFGEDSGIKYEDPLEYFSRTRPGRTPPGWLKNGWEDNDYLDFLIQLAPLTSEIAPPAFEPDGCLLWQYRKPAICPVGIRV